MLEMLIVVKKMKNKNQWWLDRRVGTNNEPALEYFADGELVFIAKLLEEQRQEIIKAIIIYADKPTNTMEKKTWSIINTLLKADVVKIIREVLK